jgi:hypothetical protein
LENIKWNLIISLIKNLEFRVVCAVKAVTLKNLFGRKMLLPVSVKQLDEGGVSVLRDAATDEEFEITYTQLKRSSDAKGADRYFYGVCSFLANLAKVEPLR